MKPLTPARLRAAWLLALAVDAIQIGLLPTTGPLSFLLDAPLDLAAMFVLWRLLGWHWAFMPSFLIELLPVVDLAPTWTLAVWLATRKKVISPEIP